MPGQRLVVVANRLPVQRRRGNWVMSPGGLVSALTPVLQDSKGSWVGWSGVAGSTAPEPFEHEGIEHRPVPLSSSEVDNYYYGFCNGTLWPLYHDAVRRPEFHRHWWRPYHRVNQRFAEAAAEVVKPGDLVWVQDYHLQLVPGMLRRLHPEARIGFFLHIPFPAVELFAQIPWRRQILEGMLGADVIGFHTRLGSQNFIRVANRFTSARGGSRGSLEFEGRHLRVDRFPISIDFKYYEDLARTPSVAAGAQRLRRQLGERLTIILGVDRLDYTKGIDIRLRALETLLENQPHKARELALVQIASPSREQKEEYADMRARIEEMVGRINGTYGRPDHVPVHYLHRTVPSEQLVSYYLAADVMLVTPLRDGMNLVAKEYVASRYDNSGVLVLSEFTGAAYELRRAIQVNPYDIDGLAAALETAMELPEHEARERMAALRNVVRRNDVYRWADSFLDALRRG
ncbi:MAG: trehalose-6-phosphate synthase [Actinomycetota bacterium]|nr:trehalose-6-phosphate synthase [Actinomycetota bacterium]